MNLVEIGEPLRADPPGFLNPQIFINVRFEYINKDGKADIRMHLGEEIKEDTKIIISATEPLGRGKRKVDDSWYKKIGVVGNEFKSGDSILAQYLQLYKDMKDDFYKICFKYREVHKISGISNFDRTFKMYSEPEISN